MNNECPFCGRFLVGDVESKHTRVPLYQDGYVQQEGDQVYSEVSNVRCPDCDEEIPCEYLFCEEDAEWLARKLKGVKYHLSSAHGEEKFDSKEELKEHIKAVFNRSGNWDWIDGIRDSGGKEYACRWTLEIVEV